MVCGPSISCEDDEDMLDLDGDRLDFVKDSDLIQQAVSSASTV